MVLVILCIKIRQSALKIKKIKPISTYRIHKAHYETRYMINNV